MRMYELTTICSGSISDSEIVSAWDRVQKVLTDAGATDVQQTLLGKIKLQYPIADQSHGHAAHFLFSTEPAASHTIQQKLKLTNDVIRFVIEVHVPARVKKQPQIADTILLKASRREREKDKDEERGEGHTAREARDTRVEVPVFAATHAAPSMDIQQKAEQKEVNLAEIDKKLDELLAGDLTPTI